MHEYQLTFQGESDAAVADIVKNPESVRSEYVEFGKNGEHFTGLAVYLTPENEDCFNLDALRTYGIDFLRGLSPESYYNRFISSKPNNDEQLAHTVDHFLEFDGRYHTTIAVLHEDKIIGAVSSFKPKTRALCDTGVTEVSITIADEFQGQGLGKQLFHRIITQSIDDGFTHIATNFAKGNNASISLVTTALGTNNIVAGNNNLEEKYFRLGVTNPKDDIALEAMLRGFAGVGNTTVYQPIPESTPKRHNRSHTISVPGAIRSIIAAAMTSSHPETAPEMQLTFDIEDIASQIRS